MNAIDGRITAVFQEVFSNDALRLTDQTTFADVPGWDSLAHVKLISALEAEFDTKFTVRDVMKMTTVGAIRQAVEARAGKSV
jgi:acyl carrier protein